MQLTHLVMESGHPIKKARLETTLGKAGDELRVYIMGTNEGFDDEWAPIDSNLGSLVGATDRVEVLQVKKVLLSYRKSVRNTPGCSCKSGLKCPFILWAHAEACSPTS